MQDSSGDPAPPPCLQMAALWHTPALGDPRCPSDQARSGHLLEFALGFLLASVPLVEGKVSVWVCTHTHVHTHTRVHTHTLRGLHLEDSHSGHRENCKVRVDLGLQLPLSSAEALS